MKLKVSLETASPEVSRQPSPSASHCEHNAVVDDNVNDPDYVPSDEEDQEEQEVKQEQADNTNNERDTGNEDEETTTEQLEKEYKW